MPNCTSKPLYDALGNSIQSKSANFIKKKKGFINFIVKPLFKAWEQYMCEDIEPMLNNLSVNLCAFYIYIFIYKIMK